MLKTDFLPEPLELEVSPGRIITIDCFRPEDAPGIAALFRAVYGEGYPVKHFYHPEELIKAHEKGVNYSVVLRDPKAGIVGQLSFYRSSPYPHLYESGAAMVHPDHQNAPVLKAFAEMLGFAYNHAAPGMKNMETIWGEGVCNKIFTQKRAIGNGHIPTGLEVDLMPAEAYEIERRSTGRVSSLVACRTLIPHPHTVYLPKHYEAPLHDLYAGFDDSREALTSEAAPAFPSSHFETQCFDFAKVARIWVRQVGQDFESGLHNLEAGFLGKATVVFQVWVNLGDPANGHAVEILKKRGYFFGGLFPRWFGTDGFMMQKIVGRPNWDEIQLYSDRAKQIGNLVREDWERTQ